MTGLRPYQYICTGMSPNQLFKQLYEINCSNWDVMTVFRLMNYAICIKSTVQLIL